MVQIQKLTPETLLSAPRRGVAVPSPNGKLALYTVSTHTFGDKTISELRVMDIETGQSVQLSDEEKVHDARWIPGTGDEVIYLKSGEKGKTTAYVASGADASKEHYVAAEFDAPVANVKLKALDDGDIIFVVTGLVDDKDGSLYNEEAVKKTSSGRVFDTVNVRVWNGLFKANKYSLWYNKLTRADGKWKLAGDLHNLVKDANIEAPGGMYDVADPLANFDVCHKGIAFLGRDLNRREPAFSLSVFPYFVPLDSFTLPPPRAPRAISWVLEKEPGFGVQIRITPDASTIGFLHTKAVDMYNARLYLASVESLNAFDVFAFIPAIGEDHDPPGAFEFTKKNDEIILQSQKSGKVVLSHLKLHEMEKPEFIISEGAVQAFYPLGEGNWETLLVSSSSFIDSSLWEIVSVVDASVVRTVSSSTKHGAKYGISKEMVSDIWFEGADDICNQSFMIRPSDFDENKKYPWVFLPHGGPISAWNDSWTLRWNMAAIAEMGYVVICPNITGSTGFGADFARRVNDEWGGRPFQDLLNLVKYLEKLPYLDQDKAVLAGASYSGYLVSWFFGHEIAKKFCCAVWHDGIFNIPTSILSSDFIINDGSFAGEPYAWNNAANLEKWNPARPELLRNWKHAPPTIVVHSEKDYRCPITEGVATFNTLQLQGVPSRFLTFPDECHWVLGAENSLVWYETVWGWVKRCVDGEIKRGDKTW